MFNMLEPMMSLQIKLWFVLTMPQKPVTVVDLFLGKDTLMPCPFTEPKMFCAGPNILSQHKNLTAFSASSKTFVLAQKPILPNANHLFVWHKMFVTATKCL